ncbi:uncharacterized protein LOC126195470 [Schistocerca nitens]|uniref:uncharacterized protein LOC126195470 n=1 Tax=Schistocerca nitens TaxID=7011 RepID=UPI002117B2BD|nr:uncharacterized protein LOC126195470 [Schistocerca nitens]
MFNARRPGRGHLPLPPPPPPTPPPPYLWSRLLIRAGALQPPPGRHGDGSTCAPHDRLDSAVPGTAGENSARATSTHVGRAVRKVQEAPTASLQRAEPGELWNYCAAAAPGSATVSGRSGAALRIYRTARAGSGVRVVLALPWQQPSPAAATLGPFHAALRATPLPLPHLRPHGSPPSYNIGPALWSQSAEIKALSAKHEDQAAKQEAQAAKEEAQAAKQEAQAAEQEAQAAKQEAQVQRRGTHPSPHCKREGRRYIRAASKVAQLHRNIGLEFAEGKSILMC